MELPRRANAITRCECGFPPCATRLSVSAITLSRHANERAEFPNRISRLTCTFRRPARAFPRSERGLSRRIPTRYRSRTCRCDSEPRRCHDVHARCRLMQRRCRDVPSDVFHIPLNCRNKPFDFQNEPLDVHNEPLDLHKKPSRFLSAPDGRWFRPRRCRYHLAVRSRCPRESCS